MNELKRQTRSMLMQLFERSGLHPRSDLGQNFLIDLNLIDFIVEQSELDERDVVLEVGTGTGGLTTALAGSAAAVVSVEVDPRVQAFASRIVAHFQNVRLLNCDALQDKNHLSSAVVEALQQELAASSVRRLKLVANLPYCIATPVISNLVASELPWAGMMVTIQWELAERIRARAGSEHYGALSVWLQSQCQVKVLRKLRPMVFWPRPQVDSAIVKIVPDPARRQTIADRSFFHDFTRRVFQQRRKLLRGVVAAMYREQLTKQQVDEALGRLHLEKDVRAEELDVDKLVDLSRALQEAIA